MFDIKLPGKLLVIFVIKNDLNILLVVLVILQQLEKNTNSARPMGNSVNSLYQPETDSKTQCKIGTKSDVSVWNYKPYKLKENAIKTT